MLNTSFPSKKVTYSRDFSNKICGTIPSGGWEVKDFSGDSVMVKFKSDTQSNKKGFEAVYTFVSLDGCKYWLIFIFPLSVKKTCIPSLIPTKELLTLI